MTDATTTGPTPTIRDNRDRVYSVEVSNPFDSWHFRVSDAIDWYAAAKCKIEGSTLLLQDFLVRDDVLLPQSKIIRLLRSLFNQPSKPVTYRDRGLGTALMRFIITWATQRSLNDIQGSLSPHDLRRDPNLGGWYQKLGFTVEPGGSFNRGCIRLLLQSVANRAVEAEHPSPG